MFWRYLDSSMTRFSSDILLPFPNSNDLNSRDPHPLAPDISSSSKNIRSTACLPDYIFRFLMTMMLQETTLNFNMPFLYALTVQVPNCCHGKFSQISCAEYNLCRFFPSVNTVKHWRWNFVRKCFTAWRLQLLIAKLASMMKLHLYFRCLIWLASNSKCDSESCYVRHDEDTSHSQRPEAATRGALWKKELLEISQNSQESVCVPVSFLIKFLASGLQLYWKRDSDTGIFLWILRNF